MKIQTSAPVDKNTLMAHLQGSLPGYRIYTRQSFIVAEKTGMVGANVVVRKDKVIVVGNFPNMGLQIGFVLAVVFLGVLIPLVLYFVLVYGKQKAAEQEVGGVVQQFVGGGANLGIGQIAQMGQGFQQDPYGQAPGYPQQGYPQQGYPPQPQPGYPPGGQYGQPPAGGPPQQWGQP